MLPIKWLNLYAATQAALDVSIMNDTSKSQDLGNAIHIRLEGLTAFFKHPLTITGTQISLHVPSYSTILGLISACAGRTVTHKDTRIGFEFRCVSTDIELERTDRFYIDNKGLLRKHQKGQGIVSRRIHFMPTLDLYLTNTDFEDTFRNPVSSPLLGRSQDLLWVTYVEPVSLRKTESGNIGATMFPYTNGIIVPSLIVRCPEWFYNERSGYTRTVGPVGFYQAMQPTEKRRFRVTIDNLYCPSNFHEKDDAIYIHNWLDE